eukprot:SAG11_NODE_51_length_19848_cov_37.780698_14_plen_90_part_00
MPFKQSPVLPQHGLLLLEGARAADEAREGDGSEVEMAVAARGEEKIELLVATVGGGEEEEERGPAQRAAQGDESHDGMDQNRVWDPGGS